MKKVFFLLLLALFCGNAIAVPAYPEKIAFRQPGTETTVNIYLKGDERVHWAETEDGYSLLHSDDGSLVYAIRDKDGNMIPSNFMATDIEQRSDEVLKLLKVTPKHLRFSKQQINDMLSIWKQVEDAKSGPKAMTDVTGEKKFLVILFAFNDKPMAHNKMHFKFLFNQVNYTTGNRTGSVRDYYYDVSGGLFTLRVDIVGPYIGKHNTAYYGDSDYGYQAFAREAVDSAAQEVDFSDYDNDNDGYIDGLHIIFAGHGEEAGAGSECIWSHKWNIFDAPTYNNTVIDVYSCSPECKGSYGNDLTNIGVICHELGHVFGAPDYYDTDYEQSGGQFPGLGAWDIMSGGSWNHGGITPAQHNPYTKIYIYKWATCDTIDATPRTVILNPSETSNAEFHRVNTSTPGDFFLIENRQQIKWDEYVPGTGMLVYHIHPNVHGASVANYTHPQGIYILAFSTENFPNSNPDSYGQTSSNNATYPGAMRRTSLTDNTTPWFRPWSQQPNNTPFYNISENTSTKKVFFTVGNASPEPITFSGEGIDRNSIALQWTTFGSYNVMLVVNAESNTFGTPDGHYSIGDTIDGGGIVAYKGNAASTLLTELLDNHLYHFRLFSCINDTTYTNGIDAQASTLNCDIAEWQTEDFENYEIGQLPECWAGEWSVDSILGQKALTCSGEGWHSTTCRPFSFDSISDAVLHFELHFDDLCDETSCVKTEYRNEATGQRQTLDSTVWVFGNATWRDIYLQLPEAGNISRLRFSAFTRGEAKIAIDNISIEKGTLVYASCDDNGDISPRGYSTLKENDTIHFRITPLAGFSLKELRVNNVKISMQNITELDDGTFLFDLTDVNGQQTVNATFKRKTDIQTTEQNNINIYPNPAGNTVTIASEPGSTIAIYDITGHLISEQIITSSTMTFNIESLPKGIYIVRIDNYAAKLVKK